MAQFSRHPKARDGLQQRCRACANAAARASYLKDPDRVKARAKRWAEKDPERRMRVSYGSKLRKHYGITHAQYDEMHRKQGGLCAVCLRGQPADYSAPRRFLLVDHCHQSGAVRALLCSPCNVGLGRFEDDPARLRSAATYIEKERNA